MTLTEALSIELPAAVNWWKNGWHCGRIIRLTKGKNGHNIAIIEYDGKIIRKEIGLLNKGIQ